MTKEILLDNGMVALVDDADFDWLDHMDWQAKKGRGTFYASLGFGSGLMHRAIIRAKKGEIVDHVNGNGLDNRRQNLRICTRSENASNYKRKLSKAGYRGVKTLTHLRRPRFAAEIRIKKKTIHLGYFDTPEEAARVYDEEAKKYHGKFATLNFP